MQTPRLRVSLFAVAALALGAHAQCTPQWSAAGPDAGLVWILTTLPNGDVIAAGNLTIGGVPHTIGRLSGGTWSPLGSGVTGPIDCLLALPNGDVIVGGNLTSAGGVPVNRIARWNGTAWSPLGAGFNGDVLALARMPNGDIIAGGSFGQSGGVQTSHIARWNGSTWSALGGGIGGSLVLELAILPNGDLVAKGDFFVAGGTAVDNVARWNGTNWAAMGTLSNASARLIVAPNGEPWLLGYLVSQSGSLVRWDGTAWQALSGSGIPIPYAGAFLPDGDLLLGGRVGQNGPYEVRRLRGASWTTAATANNPIWTMQRDALDRIVVGGSFSTIGGANSSIANMVSTCPALASSGGGGCVSSGGANLLAATALPWFGGTMATQATGMPSQAIAVVARGVTAVTLPLANLLTAGQPGCLLLTTPDLLSTELVANGTGTASLSLPASPTLAGAILREQWIPFELGSGGITAVTSTNVLLLTLGSF